MSVELFWASGSAPAWRDMMALEIKGVPYTSRLLEASKKEHKTPEFLAMNPRGQFPVLTDNTLVVYETRAILHYLDAAYPNPTLFGTTPSQNANLIQATEIILTYVDPAVTRLVQPVFRNQLAACDEDFLDIAQRINAEFAPLDEVLSHQAWLAGERIGGPDVALVPTMQRFVRALDKAPELSESTELARWRDTHAYLARWVDETETLPAFERSFPPHWRN